MADEVERVVKAGEQWFYFSTEQTREGLKVHVKAHPVVEEFFRNLGAGESSPLPIFGNKWESLNPEKQISAWKQKKSLAPSEEYTLDRVSVSLAQNPMEEEVKTNLSFLRLVGVSDPAGVTFLSKDVLSVPYREELRSDTAAAFKIFVRDHLKQVKITLSMIAQEL